MRIEQEKVVSLVELVGQTAREVDYKVLDELNSPECEHSSPLKAYLNAVEMLAFHWNMINTTKYNHRVTKHGYLNVYIDELVREARKGKVMNIRTFVLSCKTPYMRTKDGSKVFISKEYSNAAGKLHLNFYMLHHLITRELNPKLEQINKQANRGSILTFLKTIFTSNNNNNDVNGNNSNNSNNNGIFHPLFKETLLIRKLKRQVKIFELSIRNFEETYIAMIKDLYEKTFKLNAENNIETSIEMKKRTNPLKILREELANAKIVENQIFDFDGNILRSQN